MPEVPPRIGGQGYPDDGKTDAGKLVAVPVHLKNQRSEGPSHPGRLQGRNPPGSEIGAVIQAVGLHHPHGKPDAWNPGEAHPVQGHQLSLGNAGIL